MTVAPPYSAEAEADCFAWCVQNPRTAPDKIFALVTPADFYVPEIREAMHVIAEMVGRGEAISDDTVGARLQQRTAGKQGPDWVFRTRMGASPANDPEDYAGIVAETASCRKAMALGNDLREAGLSGSLDDVGALLEDATDSIYVRRTTVERPKYADELERTDPKYEWLIDGLIERRDRVVITGTEGEGKSVLLRQIAVCAALGRHPFTLQKIDPIMVLQLDFENSDPQNVREYQRFWPLCHRFGDEWNPKRLATISGVNVDLTTQAGEAWLWTQVENNAPELVVLGPLYKTYRGAKGRSKDSEETAELVVATLDRIRQRFGVALVMEGHSPHGEGGDRAGGRMRGSSLWQAWPEFVFHLKKAPDGDTRQLIRARGPRDRARPWPFEIRHGKVGEEFPWVTHIAPPLPPASPKLGAPPGGFDDDPF